MIFVGAGTLNNSIIAKLNQGLLYLTDRGNFHIQRGNYDAGDRLLRSRHRPDASWRKR